MNESGDNTNVSTSIDYTSLYPSTRNMAFYLIQQIKEDHNCCRKISLSVIGKQFENQQQ